MRRNRTRKPSKAVKSMWKPPRTVRLGYEHTQPSLGARRQRNRARNRAARLARRHNRVVR